MLTKATKHLAMQLFVDSDEATGSLVSHCGTGLNLFCRLFVVCCLISNIENQLVVSLS